MTGVVLQRLERKHLGLSCYTSFEVLHVRASPRDAFSEPRAALDIVPRDQLYQDCYACGRPDEHVTPGIHGPFRLELIVPEAFLDASFDEARQLLRRRIAEFTSYQPPQPAQLAAVEACLDEVLTEGRRAFILGLDPEAKSNQHDWGWVVHCFSECLVVDGSSGEAWVIVLVQD